ncbi:argininosuccinate synthase [Candidatus Microgenomates bacterium]|nr:MAG: argininosuccinate synthase [Candidatus Microgenomates bacterium]
MNQKTSYVKVASYEAKIGEVKKILLLYSGGLDTSVMLKWLKDTYKADVIALTLDLGQQHDDLEAIKKKALKLGAIKAITLDVKEEFANEYLAKGIKANASYQGDYHLSTPIGRAITAKKAVEIAKKEGADAIAHGCTGKGNDQVRIDGYILTNDPKIKIIAPVREWAMDRNEEIKYAQKNGIPIPTSIDFPYSDDDNMWGITWEGGEIVDPSKIPQFKKFLTTYTLPENAPDKEEIVTLNFEKGLPVALNGEKLTLAKLIIKLNKLAGKHGIGTTVLLEDRIVGLKNRGVYEHPGAHVIIEAHKNIEKYVCTRTLNEIKQAMDLKWGYLCYGALWFDPAMDAINAFNDFVNEKVTGEVKIKLFKGQTTVVGVSSPFALDYVSFNNAEGYDFNVNSSAGFIEIYSLQMKLANQIKNKVKKSKN